MASVTTEHATTVEQPATTTEAAAPAPAELKATVIPAPGAESAPAPDAAAVEAQAKADAEDRRAFQAVTKTAQPDAEPDDDETEPTGTAEATETEPTDGATKADAEREHEAHLRALRRDGWTQKRIAALDAETIAEVGARAKERQDRQDADYDELRTLRAGKKPEAEAPKPEPKPEPKATEADIDAIVDAIDDPDQAATVRKALLAERAARAELQRRADAAMLQTAKHQAEAAGYPQLATAKGHALLIGELGRLDPNGEGLTNSAKLKELTERACYILFGDPVKKNDKPTAPAAGKPRVPASVQANGQPAPPTRTTRTGTAQAVDPEWAAFQAVTSSPNMVVAQRKLARQAVGG